MESTDGLFPPSWGGPWRGPWRGGVWASPGELLGQLRGRQMSSQGLATFVPVVARGLATVVTVVAHGPWQQLSQHVFERRSIANMLCLFVVGNNNTLVGELHLEVRGVLGEVLDVHDGVVGELLVGVGGDDVGHVIDVLVEHNFGILRCELLGHADSTCPGQLS